MYPKVIVFRQLDLQASIEDPTLVTFFLFKMYNQLF